MPVVILPREGQRGGGVGGRGSDVPTSPKVLPVTVQIRCLSHLCPTFSFSLPSFILPPHSFLVRSGVAGTLLHGSLNTPSVGTTDGGTKMNVTQK